MLEMLACTAKFRREFSWACRTGCTPRLEQQQMSMPASQWRARDHVTNMAANVATSASRRHQRCSEVMRRDSPTTPAAATDGINPPAYHVALSRIAPPNSFNRAIFAGP